MTKFIVFTTPRTGSTLLVKSLDTHPEIFCAGEIFLLAAPAFMANAASVSGNCPYLKS